MENKKAKISIDFDGTLEREFIQIYAKKLMENGVDVWVVTSRYSDDEKYKLFFRTSTDAEITNKDLFEVTDRLGIPRDHIVFTDMCSKWPYFQKHPEFIFHLDDDWVENRDILSRTKVKAISSIGNSNFIQKCDRLLEL
jgi:hypothetical protein